MNNKIVIGIVGQIGSGKSSVSKILSEEYGFFLVDADKIAHNSFKEKEIIKKLAGAFGRKVLKKKEVDTNKLAEIVFNSEEKLKILNDIIHPFVKKEINKLVKSQSKVILDVPLLFETGMNSMCDVIIFIESTEENRINRKKIQRGWQRKDLIMRDKVQDVPEEKKRKSDFIIENNGTLSETKMKLDKIIASLNV